MELLNIEVSPISLLTISPNESEGRVREKIQRAAEFYHNMEKESVANDLRNAALLFRIDPFDLENTTFNLAKKGLYLTPFSKEASTNGFHHVSMQSNQDYTYKCVLSKSRTAALDMIEHHRTKNNEGIGELLGFPESSRTFFEEYWKKGYYDFVWFQALNTKGIERTVDDKKEEIILPNTNEFSSTLSVMRYLGVRVLPYFARSFDDPASLEFANNWIELAKKLKIDGLDEALELLNLPFEWKCYKGTAEITTPYFSFKFNSHKTKKLFVIKKGEL